MRVVILFFCSSISGSLLCSTLTLCTVLNIRQVGGSKALLIAAIWIGFLHLIVGGLGTFILKRFPTSFAVGLLLGVLLIVSNQNLILFGTFHNYLYGNSATNHVFGLMGLTLSIVMAFFSLLLFHFKDKIVVAPIDAKGLDIRPKTENNSYQLEDDQQSSSLA